MTVNLKGREYAYLRRAGVGETELREGHNTSKVETVMGEFKRGTLESSSGHDVTTRKQAVAIALSEAREAGEDVPPPKEKG